jgi:4-amino-4-deoxy-L-arabinose transferase-like glycosyltransferase
MLEHKGYSITHLNTVYHCFGYPAYSFVCAFLHWLTNRNYFVIEMFQIILAVFSSYFVYKTAEKIFNEKVGMLALFFSAVHPGLIVYSTKMHELTFTVFFVTLLFFLMTRINIFGWRDNMLLGVLIGLGALTRPTAVLFFPSYLVYIFLISRSVKKILKPSFIVFIMMALVILPWALRNYSIHKRYILLTTTSAEHLWRGNNPFSSGTALTLENKDILSAAPIDFQQMVYSRNEIQQHDLFCSQALKYIMADPARFARSTLKKIFYFWWFAPQSGLWYLRAWLVIYKIFYSFILIFFILGLYS